MAPDDIQFSSLKEDRGWYFVEYSPPMPNYRFSVLQITVIELRNAKAVAAAMEVEAKEWLGRYPVPLMATAFSLDGSVLSLDGVRPISHLMAWVESAEMPTVFQWALVENEALPKLTLNREQIKNIFADIPSRTGREIYEKAAKDAASRSAAWWLVFLWAVVVPLIVAVVEWSSDLLGLLVLGYAFVKATIGTLRLTGHIKKSKRQLEKEAEEIKMRHHHYHCERNPTAFERLKVENLQQEEIERTKAEALALKNSVNHTPINANSSVEKS